MDLRKWQEEYRNENKDKPEIAIEDKFYGRNFELSELHLFLKDSTKRIFCLYGVPMIGKSTLIRELIKTTQNYQTTVIRFSNPESPEIPLEKITSKLNSDNSQRVLIVVENFEEALFWKGNQDQLHEINYPKIKLFLEKIIIKENVRLVLESRFQINLSFLQKSIIAELSTKQLGKIDRKQLFDVLNEEYRNETVTYKEFEKVCDKLNDHIWLIKLAMQNNWIFENVIEAVDHPESLTQKLWRKLQTVINRLSRSEKTLLCAFGITNPIFEKDLKTNLEVLSIFSKKGELVNALLSLRKKLLLTYDPLSKSYEINNFLREVCFTHLQEQKEMKALDEVPFFRNIQKPKYNNIQQSHERGDYATFFRFIKEKRKRKEYDEVIDILKEVYWTDPKKEVILNEIAVTYKWKRDIPEATSILEQLIKDYNHIPAFTELAIIYKEEKKYQKAIDVLNKALLINPKDVKTKNELAIVNKEMGNIEIAIELFNELIEKYNHVPAYTELSIIYRDNKKFQEAINVLKKALAINENDLTTLNQLAINFIEISDFENALFYANRGLKLDRNNYFLKTTFTNITKAKSKNIAITQNPLNTKQKILFLAANPTNESRLQTDIEYRIIKAEIKRGSHRDFFEFLEPQFAVTITELIRAVNAKPDIIHFSGHGDIDGIAITTENNNSQTLPLNAIERLFQPLQNLTKLIILNSCYSSVQAKAISKFGMYVVGNNLSIKDGTAISFSKGFYNGISEGKEFKAAFNDALIVVMTEDNQYENIIEVWKDGEKISI